MRSARLDALIPIDAEPAQGVDELQVALLAVTRGIRVFDAEDELAARVARVGPVEQRGAHHADVGGAGGRGAEPDAHVGAGRLREGERHPLDPIGAQPRARAADAASASATPSTCTGVNRSRSTTSASSTVPRG